MRLILLPQIAINSIKGMYNISNDQTWQKKSSRAGLFLDIGKVQQWMCTVKFGKYILEYAAVYLTAGHVDILEEVSTQCLFAYIILMVSAIFFITYILYILVFSCLVIMQTSSTLPVGSVISSFHPSEGENALSPIHYRGDLFLILV